MYARIAVEPLEEMSDADLIRLCKVGNERALNVLLDRHRESLYRFCLHLVSNREDAEDICQESLARAITQVDTLRSGAAFRTWLFRIARNLSVDSFRNQRRLCPLPEDEIIPLPLRTDSPHEDVEQVEERETVVKALNTLAESHQRVLVLREVEGKSYADIAQQLNVSHSAVETLLFRARRRLREEYSKRAVPAVALIGSLRDLMLRLPATAPEVPTAAKVAVTAALVSGTVITGPHWAQAVRHLGAPATRHVSAPVHGGAHRRSVAHRAAVPVRSFQAVARVAAPSKLAAPATGATAQHQAVSASPRQKTHAVSLVRHHAASAQSRHTHSRKVSLISSSSHPTRSTSRPYYHPVSSPGSTSPVTTVRAAQTTPVGASNNPAPAPASGQTGRGTPPASSSQPTAPVGGSGSQHGNPSVPIQQPSAAGQQNPAPSAPSTQGNGQGRGQATAPGQVGKSSPPGQSGGNANAPGQGNGYSNPPEQQPGNEPVAGTQNPSSGQGQVRGSGNGGGNGQGTGEGTGHTSGTAGTTVSSQSPSPTQPSSQTSGGQQGNQSGNEGHGHP